MANLEQFRSKKYVSLETFKKNGQGVKTPVWFVFPDETAFYIYTEQDSWKVKRIRNNGRVRVAPSDIRGNVVGEWVDGRAEIIDGEERKTADRLLDQKYFLKKIFNFLTKINRHKRAMIKVVVG
jgi:uncharacterized protein